MDGEPAATTQAKRIAERDDIYMAAIASGADHFAGGDGDSGYWKTHRQVFKVHCGGGRLRRSPEAGEPLLSRLDHTMRADANEIRREKTRSFLRCFCVQPLVFNTQNTNVKNCPGRGRGLRLYLCGCAEERRNREQQTRDDV